MGVQSMYQKFYSAKSPTEAKRAVALWIVGTIAVETLVVAIAVYGAAAHWADLKAFEIAGAVKAQVADGRVAPGDAAAKAAEMAAQAAAAGSVKPAQLVTLRSRLAGAFAGATDAQAIESARVGIDPASIVLQAAEDIASRGGIGLVVGLLLLGAACAVVLSTGMNYLLSPTTNIMRDIYQSFLNPDADQKTMVALQKVAVVVLGVCAFLMIFIPTVLHAHISVLRYSYFAYTMYGVAITPALLAALAWRRTTRAGGLASIVSGAVMALVFELLIPNVFPGVLRGGDPWGIPSIYPAALVSIGALVVVSLLTPRPSPKELEPLFGDREPGT
jgi:SSS family solute:Na+ symporter